MEGESSTLALGLQLVVAGGLMLLMTVVHALGLTAISRTLGLRRERLEDMDFNVQALLLMCGMALMLLALHTLEIWIFAGFFLIVGAMQTLEEALYYSASAYATLGRTADYFPDEWRLIGAIEALIGFLLIGWSTAFMVRKVNQLRE
jgi:hypothetical protein